MYGLDKDQDTWQTDKPFRQRQSDSSSSSSSSTVCPLYSGFPSPKTKFRHLSLSPVSSSVSPWFVMLRLTPSIHLSLGLPLLRVPSGSHSKTFSGSLFPGILFTCPNHRSRFSSVTYKMFFPNSMISLMVTFRTFSFLDLLADLLQRSISVASNLFACCVFSVHVSAPYSKILLTKTWYISFFFWFCEG
jgi:hypothetical protein